MTGHPGRQDGEGGRTARRELLALLDEATHTTRKHFGMFGQIQIFIRDVSPGRLAVTIWTRKPLDGAAISENVRNALLNWLRDLVPVRRFVATYENPELGISGERHELPFVYDPSVGDLKSSSRLIEANAGPAREALRPRFRAAWLRLLAEEGS